MDAVPVARIILYVRDIPKVAAFYQTHFGLQPLPGAGTGWLEPRAEVVCARDAPRFRNQQFSPNSLAF